jgi:hypothetical protein
MGEINLCHPKQHPDFTLIVEDNPEALCVERPILDLRGSERFLLEATLCLLI